MRLLSFDEKGVLSLTDDQIDDLPPYAILSHTWGNDKDEVTFQDLKQSTGKHKPGYRKIEFCGKQAAEDGLKYFWIDTCCIDKSNLSELSEALISMFRWYQQSKKCYVFLCDVSRLSNTLQATWESSFRKCKWLTRGWTLQELISPPVVELFSLEWYRLGDKLSLAQVLSQASKIPAMALQASSLSEFTFEDIEAWAQGRQTKRPEDMAYCLQGMLEVVLPPLYGEGYNHAYHRLRTAVSQRPVPTTVLDAYIRNRYYDETKLRIERLSGEELNMDHCYINLAIIKHQDQITNKLDSDSERAAAASPFSLLSRLQIETPKAEFDIQLPTLFKLQRNSDGHEKRPKRIFIRGRAGIGKTTLCKKIVSDFKLGIIWNDLFKRVLWLPLRHLKAFQSDISSFEELFRHEYFRNHQDSQALAKSLTNTIRRSEEHGGLNTTLFVLDGLDEVSQDWDPTDGRYKLLLELLNQPNVIITSRPYARLPSGIKSIDLELETVGFYPNQVKEYLERNFNNEEKRNEILSFLSRHQLLNELVRIPIQLDALCFTWDSYPYFDNATPSTMTSIYQAIEERLWRKDAVRLRKLHRGKPVTQTIIESFSAEAIERTVQDEIRFLECLAFTGLCNDVIEFDQKAIDAVMKGFRLLDKESLYGSTPCELSFLRTSSPSESGHSNQNHHFLHLTFQEYFAARYFACHWVNQTPVEILSLDGKNSKKLPEVLDPTAFLVKCKYSATHDIFWRFVTGLLDKVKENEIHFFFKTLQERSPDLLGPTHQRLIMHCLSEVTTPMPQRKVLESKQLEWLIFEIYFTGSSFLAREMEFPNQALCSALQHEDKTIVLATLEGLTYRQSGVLDDAFQLLLQLLDGSDKDVRKAVVQVMGNQPDLSPETLQLLIRRLKDPDEDVRSAATEAIGVQQDLSPETLQLLIRQLEDPNTFVRRTAVEAIGARQLSDQIVESMANLLRSDELGAFVEQVLRPHGDHYSRLLCGQYLDQLYPILLKRSFREQCSWYIEANESYVILPEGLQKALIHDWHTFSNRLCCAKPAGYPVDEISEPLSPLQKPIV